MGRERVVVVLDASKDINCNGIVQSLSSLQLYPGDELTLLGLLHLITDSKGTKGINSSFLREEFTRKKEQLYQTLEKLQQSTILEKIKLNVELQAGYPRKSIVIDVAKNIEATWVILDRVMKKDKKYYIKNLMCKISKFKRNNTVDLIRESVSPSLSIDELPPSKSPNSNGQVSYDEMIPGDSWEELHQSPRASDTTGKNSSTWGDPNDGEESEEVLLESYSGTSAHPSVIRTYICSVCANRRPRFRRHRECKYAELHEATKGFSEDNFLGEGGFGSVYRGELKNGMKIAVKQHKDASLQGEKEFRSELEVLSKVRHENLVMLLGSCSDGTQRLLVYEYICNGSLDQHISKRAKGPFTWEHRMKIALGAAKGLQYLHSHNIVHRDMRPNNILITHDYESLVGDFGLAKKQHDSNSGNSVVGTLGYMAPEYAQTGNFSTKMDVYSFGVVLLQLITGRRTTDMIPGGKSLIKWAKPLLNDRNYPDLIDKRIIDSHDVLQLFWMVQLTEKCISTDPCDRFTMEKVVETLNSIRDGSITFICDNSPIADSIIGNLESFDIEEYERNRL